MAPHWTAGLARREHRSSDLFSHLSPATKFHETRTSVALSTSAKISQLAQKTGQVVRQIDTQCNQISVGNQTNLKPILPFILIIIFELYRYSFQVCFLPPCKCKDNYKIHLFSPRLTFVNEPLLQNTWLQGLYWFPAVPCRQLQLLGILQRASQVPLTCQFIISHLLASGGFK